MASFKNIFDQARSSLSVFSAREAASSTSKMHRKGSDLTCNSDKVPSIKLQSTKRISSIHNSIVDESYLEYHSISPQKPKQPPMETYHAKSIQKVTQRKLDLQQAPRKRAEPPARVVPASKPP